MYLNIVRALTPRVGLDMTKLKIGFIGAGRMGNHHAQLLSKMPTRAELTAVADVDVKLARQLSAVYGANAYHDYHEMLDKEALDAVFILTPPDVRLEPIQMACERMLHVFCEKPPACRIDEANQIADIIDTAGLINSVGFNYRWYKSVDRVRELLTGKAIACVQSIFTNNVALNPSQPKWTFIQENSGGPILEQAIHSLDIIRYVVGDIDSLSAFGGNPVLPKSEVFTIQDSHAINLYFASSAVGVHLHSWVVDETVVQLRLFGVNFDMTLDLIPPGSIQGTIRDESVDFKPTKDDPFVTQITGFLDAIERKDQSIIRSSYKDAVQTLAVTLAAIDSVSSSEADKQ